MEKTYICLFDLPPYDRKVAPALRQYAREFEPKGVVELLREVRTLLPELRKEAERPLPGQDDCEHWIDSIGPDAGYKPSEQTLRELCGLLIQPLCVPHGTGCNPMQDVGKFEPWLTSRSEWFADLMDGGEELAGGRLEFSFGSGALVATREQIAQFLEEVEGIAPPDGELRKDYDNLRKLLETAAGNRDYTLLKTTLTTP